MRCGIIKNEFCFMPEYVPSQNPCREEELTKLQNIFSSLLRNPEVSPVCILTGPVGSGKTMLSKKLGTYLQEMSKMYGLQLHHVYVNCMFDRTPQLALGRIVKSLSLVLDEVSSLIAEDNENIVYSLLRTGEIWGNSPIALLLIAKDLAFMWNIDESVRSSLQKVSISLSPYTDEQLYKIVMSRAEEGLEENSLDDEAAKLIASLAGDYGDARYAIELLYRSALAALERGTEVIGVDE